MLSFCNLVLRKFDVDRLKKIWFLFLLLTGIATNINAQTTLKNINFDFYGDSVALPFNGARFVDFKGHLSDSAVLDFYNEMEQGHYEATIAKLKECRENNHLDDWLFYQLIRMAAEAISPKKDNYIRYTLYKWFFLQKSGYDTELAIAGDTILFFTQCDENIYDIPSHVHDGKRYVCLNYHDYGYNLNLDTLVLYRINIAEEEGRPFSYKLTSVPAFKPSDYKDKDLNFDYLDVPYHFKVKINDKVKSIYANYPVADYQLYFNMPMSKETYNSIVPKLKSITRCMTTKGGIDYTLCLSLPARQRQFWQRKTSEPGANITLRS